MDPMSLAAAAVSLLSPYVSKGAEEFAKELGKDPAHKAENLYSYLERVFAPNSEESQGLSLFGNRPEKYEPILEDVLKERAGKDTQFAGELEQHVNSASPYIKVVQSLKEGRNVVGAEVKEAKAGTFDIHQEADKGEELTGFKADKVG